MERDLLALLQAEYVKEREIAEGEIPAPIKDFIEFGRKYLLGNRPSSMSYGTTGMSVRLQDATEVAIVQQEEPPNMNGGISFSPTAHVGGLPNRGEVHITGKRQ